MVLEKLLRSAGTLPADGIKQRVLAAINKFSLDNLPETNRESDHRSWLEAVQPLLPAESVDTIIMKELRRDGKIVQILVISVVDVPEEIHEEYTESFFILEGRCACTIDGQVFELSAGDFLDIPLHVPHDVKLITPQVTAILQYKSKEGV